MIVKRKGDGMRENYNIEDLNPRENLYAKKLRQQVTINLDTEIVTYFKTQASMYGIPYQTLINLYLSDCVSKKRELQISWE